MSETFVIEKGEDVRLDRYLTEELDITRSYIAKLIRTGNITVDGKCVKCGKVLKSGQVISVDMPVVRSGLEPQNIPIDIIYEDDDIAVINKAQGISVHPANGYYSDTLVNALLYHLKNLSAINGVERPGIVHRLDKDTSGVMVVAKNDVAHLELSRQIAERKTIKVYTALVENALPKDSDTVITKIGRNPKDRKLMAVVSDGREAVTKYKVMARYKRNTLAEFNIITGRTHQIRVHCKYLNCPVVGDKTYGFIKQRFDLQGQLLHSTFLTFMHPTTKKMMTFTAPLPDYFLNILKKLEPEIVS